MINRLFLSQSICLACVMLLGGGCAVYYTRAFLLSDKVPAGKPPAYSFGNYLPEKFESWLVELSAVSVRDCSEKAGIDMGRYYFELDFRLPQDTVGAAGKTYPAKYRYADDTSTYQIRVDALHVRFVHSDDQFSLPALSRRPHRRISFGYVHIPPAISQIEVGFEARLTSEAGEEIAQKQYRCALVRYEHKHRPFISAE